MLPHHERYCSIANSITYPFALSLVEGRVRLSFEPTIISWMDALGRVVQRSTWRRDAGRAVVCVEPHALDGSMSAHQARRSGFLAAASGFALPQVHPSETIRPKSASESSSHAVASCFRARRWAVVNFCATFGTSVEYVAPSPVPSPLAILLCGHTAQLRQSNNDRHRSDRKSSIGFHAGRDGGSEQSMMGGSPHRRSRQLLPVLHRAAQCVRRCCHPTPAPAPRISQRKVSTGRQKFRTVPTDGYSITWRNNSAW